MPATRELTPEQKEKKRKRLIQEKQDVFVQTYEYKQHQWERIRRYEQDIFILEQRIRERKDRIRAVQRGINETEKDLSRVIRALGRLIDQKKRRTKVANFGRSLSL